MTCDTSAGLLIFYYIRITIDIILIVVPIILIIMCSVDLLNAVVGNEKIYQKSWSIIIKRVIIAIIILILPAIISLIMSFSDIKSEASECMKKATKENIEKLEKEEKAKKEIEEEKRRKKIEMRKKEIEEKVKAIQATQSSTASSMPGSSRPTGIISQTVKNLLNLPYYNQCDGRWGSINYDTGGATLCSSSCGYTSLAMVASGLSGNRSINPYSVIKDIRNLKDGEKTSRGYGAASTSELTSSSYISKYGISAQSISNSSITSSLKVGKPVIVLVPGHYLTLSISSNGNIVVLDPFTEWASPLKGVGEYKSVSDIESAYGSISWAAAYQKL